MKTSYECVLKNRLPSNAQHIFSEMVQDWLNTISVNYDIPDKDEDGSITIRFSSPEDTLMFEMAGLPNHLNKYIIRKTNTKF